MALFGPDADRTRETASPFSPGSRENGEAAESAEEHGPVLVMLGPDQGPDEGGPGGSIGLCERLDLLGSQAANLPRPHRVPFRHPVASSSSNPVAYRST